MGLPGVSPVADEAALVLVPAVLVELVAVVEALAAEGAQGVALEAGLVDRAGLVVAVPHMSLQLLVGEQLVLVGEDLLVARAEVAHLAVVDGAHVAVEVGPAEAGEVARVVGAVVSQQEDRVAHDVLVRVPDPDIVICARDVGVRILFESFRGVVCEDD